MFNRLQYISQGKTAQEQFTNIVKVLDSGGNWIQLRFKNAEQRALLELGEKVKKQCENYKATFIINDSVEAVSMLDADGVHVGLKDRKVKEVRDIIGSKKIIGGTANTFDDILQRIEEKCDYIGLGPYSYTTTKENLSPIIGLQGYLDIMQKLQKYSYSVPIYAIGGIQIDDIIGIRQTGIYGIAVSGLLTLKEAPKELILQLNKKLYETS